MDIGAQSRPGLQRPVEPSIFESVWFYAGVLAIAGLIALVFYLRRKEAAAATQSIIVPPAEGAIRLTFRENQPEQEAPKPRLKKPATKKTAKPLTFSGLPISTFTKLKRANPFPTLPESDEQELLEAIELTHEDSEEDLGVRTGALKLLATFKTANSIFAIAQVALYDLSSKLRADAVSALAEMDHESVFETIVTACADPAREVRAAAARALVNLSFDRGQAWGRIIESGDMGRMRHAARSAVESDLVLRTFDRLIHTDRSIAYEAFALTALLVRSGETDLIMRTIVGHNNENVKLSLLHVLQTFREEKTFGDLSDLLNRTTLSADVQAKVNEVRSCMQMTHT